ncbi:MAG: hypothetical protein ACTHN7_09375 [Solirubrobacterales bacterium]
MLGNDLKVVDGAAAGAWIEPRLGGEFGAVTLQVPKGYESYARIFHPADDQEGQPVRWADVAETFGTTAHREMQWHAITGSPDPCMVSDSKWPGSEPDIGSMDLDELDALCGILSDHTSDPGTCFFGLCTIQSWLDAFSPDELKPLLELPCGRDHIVLTGPLSAVDQIVRDWSKPSSTHAVWIAWRGEPPLDPPKLDWTRRKPPNLIWPEDCSWLVASEVDFDSTLVGGGAELIEAIVASPALEAWQVEPTTSLACYADKINVAPQ